jgi:hypothetical protein
MSAANKKITTLIWIITIAALAATINVFNEFLNFIEDRHGVVLDDPILKMFHAHDMTWPAFLLVYGGISLMLWSLRKNQPALLMSLHAYTLMIWIRMLAMYLVPVDPPFRLIPLHDPLVDLLGNSRVLTRDLFFSGHTATLFLFFLTAQNKTFKTIFLTAAVLVAFCVLIQHVHYSIDVLAAPFFAYVPYHITRALDHRLFHDFGMAWS